MDWSAPVDTDENRRAEELVLQYVKSVFLDEHHVHGLVDFGAVRAAIASKAQAMGVCEVREDDLENLLGWVTSMVGGVGRKFSRLCRGASFLEGGFFPRRKAVTVHLRGGTASG